MMNWPDGDPVLLKAEDQRVADAKANRDEQAQAFLTGR
jgi:hypothetical protein